MKTPEYWRSRVRAVTALMVIAPVTLTMVVYLVAVQPRFEAADRARARVTVLQARVAELEAAEREATATAAPGGDGSQRDFERRTPAEDRLPEVVEALTHLATGPRGRAVQNLSIETGSRVQPSVPSTAGAAAVAGPQTGPGDPRFGLFPTPATCSPVTVTFDAAYPEIGRFFWNLRNLPTTIEVRSVDVAPAGEAPLLHVRLVLFAYQRSGQVIRRPDARG